MDTRLSIAIHLLILISEADSPLSSSQMAASVGTNPSFIRKILGALKGAGLIESHQGKAGFTLKISPDEISLLQVCQAVNGEEALSIFGIHKNPNDACLVGRYITPMMNAMLAQLRAELQESLSATTLADCIKNMRAMIDLAESQCEPS